MKSKSLSQKYQSKNEIEHVLERPNVYMGSISTTKVNTIVLSSFNDMFKDNSKVKTEEIFINDGFNKLFNEILDNAKDQYIEYPTKISEISIEFLMKIMR